MIGFSEVLQTMAAMIIFSMILINANYMIQRNSMMQIEGELEQEVISLGQEIIEEARAKSFDREVEDDDSLPPTDIPGGFTSAGELGPDSAPYENNYKDGEPDRPLFTDFDDYNDWSGTIITEHGDFEISVEVFYVEEDNYGFTNQPSTFKKIEVTVKSEFLRGGDEPKTYLLEYIRNYYAE
ncbi:MAG: hypothetical protein WEA58_14290 [Balneolaceae bacterium]